MGDKPKTARLKKLEASRVRRPIASAPVPVQDDEIPDPPAWLSPYGKAEWRRLAPTLQTLKMLTAVDFGVFGAYCDAFGMWRNAQERLNKMARKGRMDLHERALISVVNKARADMLKLSSELGITPTSRARVNTDRVGVAGDDEKIRKYLS